MRAAQAREPMPPTPSFPPQNLTPQSSTSELVGRPRTPESGPVPPSLSPGRRAPGQDPQSQRPQKSTEDLPFNGVAAGLPPQDQRRQNGYSSPRRDPPGTPQTGTSSAFSKNEDIGPDEPPQRRRPFMDAKPSQMSDRSLDSQSTEPRTVFHTPAQSPTPQVDVPPRRRPQDIPERAKAAPQEVPEPPKSALISPQPPASHFSTSQCTPHTRISAISVRGDCLSC